MQQIPKILALDPSNITRSLGYLTGRSHRLVRDAVSAELQKQGYAIPPVQLPILGFTMVHHPRSIVQRELVDMMDIDRHRISRVVKDMVVSGWLEMQPNPESKRENLLSITAEGKELFDIIAKCAGSVLERAFEGCTPEETEITENVLQKVIYNLSES